MLSFQLRELRSAHQSLLFLIYFEFTVANFQIEILSLAFEGVVLLLKGKDHGICSRNIKGEFVALKKARVLLFEIVIDNLIQHICI